MSFFTLRMCLSVSLLTLTPGFSFSLPSLRIGFLTFWFCQQSNFTAVYNFIYISPNSLSNKGHSSRQLQGHVLERGLAIYVHAFVNTYLHYVCVVNSKSQHTHFKWYLLLQKYLKRWFRAAENFKVHKIKFSLHRPLSIQSVSCPSVSALGQRLPKALSELYN